MFHGLHARIEELRAHHAERLRAVREACASPRTAAELMPVLFARDLDAHQVFFAIGEAIAHLNHLLRTGEVTRTLGSDGIFRFGAAQ